MKKQLIALLISGLAYLHVNAQDSIFLYDNRIPNSRPAPNEEKTVVRTDGILVIDGVQRPSISVYLPEKGKANGTAIIICPGGGYAIEAAGHEGIEVAKKLNEWGVIAFVLKYRLPNDKWLIDKSIGPLQDGQRAIQLVRENAAKWGIDTSRIGIMGFSAGGHLASTIATHFHKNYIDNAEGISLRPSFQILGYPVISFTDSLAHMGSRKNLVGEHPSAETIRDFSGELNITSDSPPAFLVHASDDKTVKVGNSIKYYEALVEKKIPAEMHIYEKGGHGFGMHNKTTTDDWMERLHNWMLAKKWVH